MKNALVMVAATVFLAGCGATTMTRSGPRAASRDPNCDFDILTAYPAGYAEIAGIDIEPGVNTAFTTLPDLKRHIRPYVCEVGGDVAVARANGSGMYIKATVLKQLPGRSAPPPRANAASSGGCQYDSQCKGDRVCEAGRCVTPG